MSVTASVFEHSVQFYERDAFLCDRVSRFLEEGLRAGEPAIVIATEAHRSAVEAELQRRGCHSGPITYLDARETLERFMSGVLPDEETFYSVIGRAIEQRRNGGGRIRAYGEMVDLLWRDGNPDAAIRLEELWNDIAGHYDFSLLCAYPMGNFQSESDSTGFDAICARHSHVVPTEAYAGEDDDDARLREVVSTLQQRTAALETEIALRKQLDDERRRAEEINAFLAEASATLNRSLDYDSRIREIQSLIVPRLADSCSIDVLRDDEEPSVVDAQIAPGGSSMSVPLRLPDRPLGSITLQSDVPGRYANDDLALAVELARRCAVALENARLYRLANEANRTKDEFLATLSHELRTPLTTILGWARMLTLGGLDEQMKRVAYETIERSARTQATLIDDLLDLSRVVTGKLTLQSEPVDLATIVENAVQTQQLAADTKGIAIEVITGERAIVNGDPTRLQQIVWNLLSNAIKFSETGSKVSVELERDSEDARIIVRDEGKGISPEFLPHVFEAFRQADSACTRKHGGLGLGLAIVKYLTELHGGSVSAASPGDGQGATFVVTLPLVRV